RHRARVPRCARLLGEPDISEVVTRPDRRPVAAHPGTEGGEAEPEGRRDHESLFGNDHLDTVVDRFADLRIDRVRSVGDKLHILVVERLTFDERLVILRPVWRALTRKGAGSIRLSPSP